MRHFLCLTLIAILVATCFSFTQGRYPNNKTIKGSGNVISKEFLISDYSNLKFSGIGSLQYEQRSGFEPYFRVEIDDNLLEYLIVENYEKINIHGASGGIAITPS